MEQLQEYYNIIPEFNLSGRLCNYHTGFRIGEDETLLVCVMADEWERFNQLAGRKHEIIDGIVVFNPELEPCMPDIPPSEPSQNELSQDDRDAIEFAKGLLEELGYDA